MEENNKLTYLEQGIALLLALEEYHPNAFNLFDAYGIACLKFYDKFVELKDEISEVDYHNSMVILNEAYISLTSIRNK